MEGSGCGYRRPGSLGTDVCSVVTPPGPQPGGTLHYSCRSCYPGGTVERARGLYQFLALRGNVDEHTI